MTRTILFFSCEPGGAEVLIPVIRLIQETGGFAAVVVGYGLGAQRFAAKQIACREIAPVGTDETALFDSYRPDLLVTSATSLPERDMSEKHLWQSARRRGVPTLAFVDQWQNYSVRFSGVAPSERLAYLPDYINCIDRIGETEMLREGFDPQRLVRLGQPYLALMRETLAATDGQKARKRLGIPPGRPVALFVSEPIREHYGRLRGYDQYDALRLFLERTAGAPERPFPLIKLHPKESADGYAPLRASFRDLHPLIVGGELSPPECLAVADTVYGMTSIMLIEAYLLGKPVISLQPGLAVEDPLVLSRHGLIPCCVDPARPDPSGHRGAPPSLLDVAFDRERFFDLIGRMFDRNDTRKGQP